MRFELRVNQTGPQFLCKSDSATLQQPHPEQSTARSEIPLPRSEIGDGEIGIRTSSNIKVFQFSLFFFLFSLYMCKRICCDVEGVGGFVMVDGFDFW